MLRLFRVRGRSMLPTLSEGDFILGRRLTPGQVATLDDRAIVCADHPHFGPIIKRIERVEADQVYLASDGVTGSDAHALGAVAPQDVTHRARLLIRARGGIRWL